MSLVETTDKSASLSELYGDNQRLSRLALALKNEPFGKIHLRGMAGSYKAIALAEIYRQTE
jgi:hypothetical protein